MRYAVRKALQRSLMSAALMVVLAVWASPVLAQAPVGRATDDLQVLYTFDEASGDVLDVSGVGSQLDLIIENPAHAIRTPNGGLLIGSATRLSNTTTPNKIFTACNGGA